MGDVFATEPLGVARNVASSEVFITPHVEMLNSSGPYPAGRVRVHTLILNKIIQSVNLVYY